MKHRGPEDPKKTNGNGSAKLPRLGTTVRSHTVNQISGVRFSSSAHFWKSFAGPCRAGINRRARAFRQFPDHD